MATRKKQKYLKDKDFLSQIPDWEKTYKETDELQINYSKDDWIKADAVFTENKLEILGEAVMEDWETPYMKELAEIATVNGGTILEIGFGMGISSRFIHEQKIQKHIIIEANKQVAIKAREFAGKASYPTVVLEGLWEDVIDQVSDESIDGILFDAYPLNEMELYQAHFSFFSSAQRKLRGGGDAYLLLR